MSAAKLAGFLALAGLRGVQPQQTQGGRSDTQRGTGRAFYLRGRTPSLRLLRAALS
ncbi:hypothetical protein PT2222_210048 [Paraburkholderia tropica]